MTNIIRNKETVGEAYEKGLRESKMRNRTSQFQRCCLGMVQKIPCAGEFPLRKS